jgi:hypothetical protein
MAVMITFWLQLVGPFQAALAGVIAEAAISRLLTSLIALQSEELEAMLRVESKVNALVGGPFQEGQSLLEIAAQPHRSAEDRAKYLDLALIAFLRAQAQQQGFDQAVAQLYVALSFALLGHPIDANEWLQKAYVAADAQIATRLQQAQRQATGFRAKVIGAPRHIAEDFAALVERNSALLAAISAVQEPMESRQPWSVKDTESLEWVRDTLAPGGPFATVRRLEVYRGGELMTKLPGRGPATQADPT